MKKRLLFLLILILCTSAYSTKEINHAPNKPIIHYPINNSIISQKNANILATVEDQDNDSLTCNLDIKKDNKAFPLSVLEDENSNVFYEWWTLIPGNYEISLTCKDQYLVSPKATVFFKIIE